MGVLSGSFLFFAKFFRRVVAIRPSENGVSEGRQRQCVAQADFFDDMGNSVLLMALYR